MQENINEKAKDKIWSKYIQCENEIKKLKYDIEKGIVGGITLYELKSVLENVEKDHAIYAYIYMLLETKDF